MPYVVEDSQCSTLAAGFSSICSTCGNAIAPSMVVCWSYNSSVSPGSISKLHIFEPEQFITSFRRIVHVGRAQIDPAYSCGSLQRPCSDIAAAFGQPEYLRVGVTFVLHSDVDHVLHGPIRVLYNDVHIRSDSFNLSRIMLPSEDIGLGVPAIRITDALDVQLADLLFFRTKSRFTGRALSINKASVVVAKRCHWRSDGVGGAVLLDWAAFECNDCTFVGLSLGLNSWDASGAAFSMFDHSTLVLRDSTFRNNSVQERGGAIFALMSSIAVSGCLFVANHADAPKKDAGALYAGVSSAVTIDRCVFTQNTAMDGAGAILVEFNTTLIVVLSHFSFNNATLGGAMALTASNVTIRNSTFLRNNALNSGGAIYAISAPRVEHLWLNLIHSNFHQNMAADGGAVLFESANSAMVAAFCYFDENRARPSSTNAGRGGAISSRAGTLALSNSFFQRNQAAGPGGAVYYNLVPDKFNMSLSMREVQFVNNAANGMGGACFIYGLDRDSLLDGVFIRSSAAVYYHNSAKSGGALAFIGTVLLQIYNSRFIWNTAVASGGGIFLAPYFSELVNTLVLIDQSIFDFNNATNGGGIFADGSNQLFTLQRSSLVENQAVCGGGAHISNWLFVNVSNCLVANNTAIKRVTDQLVWEKDGGSGAGLHVSSLNFAPLVIRVNVTNSTFRFNNAVHGAGGALTVILREPENITKTFNSLSVVDCAFADNHADFGAAVFWYVRRQQDNPFRRCTFSANSARFWGNNFATNARSFRIFPPDAFAKVQSGLPLRVSVQCVDFHNQTLSNSPRQEQYRSAPSTVQLKLKDPRSTLAVSNLQEVLNNEANFTRLELYGVPGSQNVVLVYQTWQWSFSGVVQTSPASMFNIRFANCGPGKYKTEGTTPGCVNCSYDQFSDGANAPRCWPCNSPGAYTCSNGIWSNVEDVWANYTGNGTFVARACPEHGMCLSNRTCGEGRVAYISNVLCATCDVGYAEALWSRSCVGT